MRKRTKITITAVVAVFGAVLLACAACLALMPSASSRYVDEEHYAGEVWVNGTDYSTNHEDHTNWTAITQDSFDTATGVCTIFSSGSYCLAEDVQGQIQVTVVGSNSSHAEVDICLNGHVLCGNGADSALLIGNMTTTASYLDVYLYDCGGSKVAEEYDNVHYYKHGDAVTLSDGTVVYKGYDFSEASKDDCDGYVRGGLITGGDSPNMYYGGGVTVGYNASLYMYGGTIAGNTVTSSHQYAAAGVEVHAGYFYMYGGTIEGNYNAVGSFYTGGGVSLDTDSTRNCWFYMYGGEVKRNYTAGDGGGVSVSTISGTGSRYDYLYMYGGLIEGNYAEGEGGGVLADGNGNNKCCRFYMYAGTIRDNIASGDGGGVCISRNTDAFYTYSGTIEGNVSISGNGGGVYDKKSNVFVYSDGTHDGPIYVYGNYAGGKACNVYMPSGSYIDMTYGPLVSGSLIGVTLEAGTQITMGGASYLSDSLACFVSDDGGYGVMLNTDGSCLELYAKPGL